MINRMLNAMLLGITVIMAAISAAADYVREDELDLATDVWSTSIPHQVVDLRTVFSPVVSLVDGALHGLMYSANSWERNATEDPLRTATIIAQSGTLANGVFTPDGSAALTVGTGLTGDGTVDWSVTGASRRIYKLTHTVLLDGVSVAAGCIGYFDFSCCSTVPGGVAEGQVMPGFCLADGAWSNARVDLQEGEVRMPKKLAHVLPLVYSPTNFTGAVDGKSSHVSIVRLAGDDLDVTKWTEVPGTARTLKETTDEGEVIWRAKKGVWKAAFEIFDGETLKETQIKFFDLRNATGNGLIITVS